MNLLHARVLSVMHSSASDLSVDVLEQLNSVFVVFLFLFFFLKETFSIVKVLIGAWLFPSTVSQIGKEF